ncbi:MAG: hypothetical protein SGBAC_010676 [Bacillariaceae sp.]
MYDLPCDSCIHSDHRGSSIGYGYSGSIFGDRNSGGGSGEESKEDPENGSIQFSIQPNEPVQQEHTQRSSIEDIRRKALLLKQKFKMIHRYDEDLLDMDSLYSQSNGGDALTGDNAATIFDSIDGDQYQPELQPEPQPVHHNSQHSFGSLYSASSSSGQEGSECNGISDDPPLPRRAASNVENKLFNEEANRIASSPWKLNWGSALRTDPEPLSKDPEPESNESRFNIKTTKPPATFCPRTEEADVDSLYSVSHGEIEDILEELENDAENGLFVVENVKLAHRLDQAMEQGKRLKEGGPDEVAPHLVTSSSQKQANERDVVSIHSFATEESDDEYGYADLLIGTTQDEVCHHVMEPKSATKFVIDLKTSIDKCQESVELSSSLASELEPVEVTWNSQQVELFLNEYKRLHQSKHEEVAALESRMQQYVAGEADMKREIHTVVQKAESQQLELSTTRESLDETRQSLESQILDSENLRSANVRLEQKTADLVVSIQKCKSDAAEKKRGMERDYHNLKDSHVEMSQTLEHRLAKFQCLVRDLQAHSRKLEQDQSKKLEEVNERLDKHKRITKRYKKKYLSVCERRDAMNDELKSQRETIESLRNQLQDQKTSTATTIADLKKKLRIKKKSKIGVKKTDAVCR